MADSGYLRQRGGRWAYSLWFSSGGINDCGEGGCWCEDTPCILIDVYLPSLHKKTRPLSTETRPAKL